MYETHNSRTSRVVLTSFFFLCNSLALSSSTLSQVESVACSLDIIYKSVRVNWMNQLQRTSRYSQNQCESTHLNTLQYEEQYLHGPNVHRVHDGTVKQSAHR